MSPLTVIPGYNVFLHVFGYIPDLIYYLPSQLFFDIHHLEHLESYLPPDPEDDSNSDVNDSFGPRDASFGSGDVTFGPRDGILPSIDGAYLAGLGSPE